MAGGYRLGFQVMGALTLVSAYSLLSLSNTQPASGGTHCPAGCRQAITGQLALPLSAPPGLVRKARRFAVAGAKP